MKRALMSLAVLVSTAIAWAVPQLINYQGQLTNTSGAPLDTTVAMTFTIYSDTSTASVLWAEIHPAVTVQNGLFHVLLGSIDYLLDPTIFTNDCWLGITVGSDSEMSPYQQIVSVAHAFRVGTVDGAAGGVIQSDVDIQGRVNVGYGNTNAANGAEVMGFFNTASGSYSTVTGGQSNEASGSHSGIGGGEYNRARGDYSFIGGGGGTLDSDSNSASGQASSIAGGLANTASGLVSTITGGSANTAGGQAASVGGGNNNFAVGAYSRVGGGKQNRALGDYSVIAGGGGFTVADSNSAQGIAATIGGGRHNLALGNGSAIPGGVSNSAYGDSSFAAGFNAKALYDGSFVWGSSSTGDSTTSFAPHTLTIRCEGGARIYTNASNLTGVQLPAGQTAWSSVCDSTLKNRYGRVDTREVLEKLSGIPIERWSYKFDPTHITHMGPMAQDFWNAFHLGESDTTISTLDPDGVALAAIQELARQNSDLKTQVAQLQEQVQSLMADKQQSMTVSSKGE